MDGPAGPADRKSDELRGTPGHGSLGPGRSEPEDPHAREHRGHRFWLVFLALCIGQAVVSLEIVRALVLVNTVVAQCRVSVVHLDRAADDHPRARGRVDVHLDRLDVHALLDRVRTAERRARRG
jgi:hypothetical protein